MSRNRLISNYSAISVQCMVVRREVFDEAGGFDEKNFPESLFDADLCMKIRESGRRVVVTPFSELIWRSRKADVHPTESERASFTERWREVVENDPFYNPNLSKADASFSIKL
jgi:GT2 family glycosyltransferase